MHISKNESHDFPFYGHTGTTTQTQQNTLTAAAPVSGEFVATSATTAEMIRAMKKNRV